MVYHSLPTCWPISFVFIFTYLCLPLRIFAIYLSLPGQIATLFWSTLQHRHLSVLGRLRVNSFRPWEQNRTTVQWWAIESIEDGDVEIGSSRSSDLSFCRTERIFNKTTTSYIFVVIHGPPSHAATGSSERCLWPIELTLLGNAEQRVSKLGD